MVEAVPAKPVMMSVVVATSAAVVQPETEVHRRPHIDRRAVHRCRHCISGGNGIGLAVVRRRGINAVWLLIRRYNSTSG